MRNFGNRVSYLAVLSLLGISAPHIAHAQVDDTIVENEDTIIVTARKRDETLTEIPLSVSAFSQDALDDLGVTSAEGLSNFTPGFDFQPVGTGGQSGRANPQIRFRGVGLQISDPNAPSAAIFWDGAYVPQGIGLVPLIDLEQVEVIKGPQTAFFGRNTFAGAANFRPASPTDEFEGRLVGEFSTTDVDEGYMVHGTVSGPIFDNLRGRLTLSTDSHPGSHEFADGSPMGEEETDAILASLDFDVSDSATISYTGYFVDASDNSALSSINADVPSADCNRTYEGNLRNVVTGEIIGPFTTDLSVPPAQQILFGFLPVINTTSSTLFCGEIPEFTSSNQINPAFGRALTVGDFTDLPAGFGPFGPTPAQTAEQQFLAHPFQQNINIPAGTEDIFNNGFVDAPNGLGNTYRTWRNKVSFSAEGSSGRRYDAFISNGRFMNWGTFDNSYGASAIPSYAGFINNSEDLSAELRVTSPDSQRLRYMLGVNYQTQENDGFQTGFNILTSLESDTFGIFGAVDFDITDSLTISGEGRLQDDKSTLLQDGAPGSNFDQQTLSFQKFMPRVILSYQPRDTGINLYGSWSQSYLPGNQTGASSFGNAVNNIGTPFEVPASDPNFFDADAVGFFTPLQKLDAFEIGLKHEVNSSLRYSIAAYQMDWTNQVFFVLSPTFVSLAQAGDSEYTGVEADVDFKPTDWLSLQAAFNYVDGTFSDYAATGSVGGAVLAPGLLSNTVAVDASGNEIRYNPSTTGTFSAEVSLDNWIGLGSFVRVDAVHTGSFFIDNFEYNEVDSSTKFNLRAGADVTDTFSVEVFGNNITDDLTPTTQGGTTFTGFTQQNSRRFFAQAPRGAEYGVRLIANF